MSATIFDVTPEEITASATKVESKTGEFTKAYKDIYTAVKDLLVTYEGEASNTFNQRIQAYQNDFADAEKTLKNYVEFLRKYATDVKKTEDDIKGKAANLPTGM